MRRKWLGILCLTVALSATGCSESSVHKLQEVSEEEASGDETTGDDASDENGSGETVLDEEFSGSDDDDLIPEASDATNEPDISGGEEADANDKSEDADDRITSASSEGQTQKEILQFVDVFQNQYEVEINPEIEKAPYDKGCFSTEGNKVVYEDAYYTSRQGVDVSYHQGTIDWEQVKAAGYDFAFIRIGYRGYGTTGSVNLDKEFYNNLQGARAAGIDVGVYFFSQAISREEALEEAEFVLRALKGETLDLPVVFDPENILDDEARTDNVSGEQFTENTIAFCERIREAGYEPMIYSNMLWEAFTLDLEQLSAYPVWYADYEPLPQTPYHYLFWQYDNQATVPGIAGETDVNLQMIPRT